jgi:hypothetical protein
MILLAPIRFEDWNIADHMSVFKTFPAGTRVEDVSRPSNLNPLCLVRVIGRDGWIASVPRNWMREE